MDYFDILLAKKLSGGGGGDIDVESLTATENRTYNAGTGKAYNPVVVKVPEPTLIAKSISQNGTYNASDDNADGYSSVTVDVEGYQIKNIANVPTDIASFTDGTDLPMPKLEVGIEAVQDLHGYDAPWPAGGGKNKMPLIALSTQTKNGITFTPVYNGDSLVRIDVKGEKATSGSIWYGLCNATITISQNMIMNGIQSGSNVRIAAFRVSTGSGDYVDTGNGVEIPTSAEQIVEIDIRVDGNAGTRIDTSVYPMLRYATIADDSYAPYLDICPISGWSGAEIHNFGLPNGYKAVDYVTLTEPVVYDGITDFNRNDLSIITEFKVNVVSSYGAIYSAYSAETNNATRLIQNGTSPNSLLVNNNAKANVPSTVAQSGGYIPNDFNKFISYHSSYNINGNTSSSSVASGNNNTATSLTLGASSNSVSFRRFDIQSSRTEGGETIYTPICSLIPCINPQGVAGFWNAIGEKFYTTSDPTKITATGTPHKGTEHIADVTYPITWSDVIMGGDMDVTDGVIHPYKYYHSYNGETLVGEWLSSMDVYAEGTTPTIGAQVIDFGAFDTDISIQNPNIKTLLGNNNIWADSGQIISGQYFAEL